ncbi:VC0807 family protein [Specibacter cremeus]|uniref:VC0807 family protein n=1 Tax=Specibacter cremeus TaxID=1629051 RepID=UPI000F787BD2|nr:VC0807 family protein [Specibacter cremeus]
MRNRAFAVLRLLVALLLPVAAYYVLRALGVDTYATLLIVAAVGALPAVASLLRRRPVGRIATFYSLMSVGSLLVALLPGSTELLLAKGAILTAATGFWFLASLRGTRPLTYLFSRPLLEGRLGWPGGWEQWWQDSARFRRMWRVSTIMWAAGLFLDAAARVVMAYTLPHDDAPGVATALYVVTVVVLNVVTNAFYVFYVARERIDRLRVARR